VFETCHVITSNNYHVHCTCGTIQATATRKLDAEQLVSHEAK